ncbi:MAG TPA: hypothetical protein VD967_01735 [Candidatus Paceibacterota bacterium]|nr:hypothetical protein [Candidatus Paceibacterota bacterium]
MNRTAKWVWGAIGVLIIGGLLAWYVIDARTPGEYDELALCLAEKDVTFYGAFWCQHCAKQKQLFGRKSAKLLPYVECSTPDSKGQLQVCKDAGIMGYPTWQFADGTRDARVLTPAILAEKTGCALPASN